MSFFRTFLVLNILVTLPAYGYVDPGSGSMLLQAILAGIVGIAVYFKNLRLWFTQIFSKKDKENNSNES
jgi:hypothetical protein